MLCSILNPCDGDDVVVVDGDDVVVVVDGDDVVVVVAAADACTTHQIAQTLTPG